MDNDQTPRQELSWKTLQVDVLASPRFEQGLSRAGRKGPGETVCHRIRVPSQVKSINDTSTHREGKEKTHRVWPLRLHETCKIQGTGISTAYADDEQMLADLEAQKIQNKSHRVYS